jgi:hypothetical protein
MHAFHDALHALVRDVLGASCSVQVRKCERISACLGRSREHNQEVKRRSVACKRYISPKRRFCKSCSLHAPGSTRQRRRSVQIRGMSHMTSTTIYVFGILFP